MNTSYNLVTFPIISKLSLYQLTPQLSRNRIGFSVLCMSLSQRATTY